MRDFFTDPGFEPTQSAVTVGKGIKENRSAISIISAEERRLTQRNKDQILVPRKKGITRPEWDWTY